MARADFVFETALAGRGHARWLAKLRSSGYHTHLVFLSLPDPELAVARVAARVQRGGHHVAEEVVRRRYAAGLRNFFAHYEPAVDGWQFYDNADVSGPRLIASRESDGVMAIADPHAWQNLNRSSR